MVNAMSKINIPPAALEAGARALADAYYRNCTDGRLTMADTDDAPEDWYVEARAALLAMIEAWPGMWVGPFELGEGTMLILPLPTEASDAE